MRPFWTRRASGPCTIFRDAPAAPFWAARDHEERGGTDPSPARSVRLSGRASGPCAILRDAPAAPFPCGSPSGRRPEAYRPPTQESSAAPRPGARTAAISAEQALLRSGNAQSGSGNATVRKRQRCLLVWSLSASWRSSARDLPITCVYAQVCSFRAQKLSRSRKKLLCSASVAGC